MVRQSRLNFDEGGRRIFAEIMDTAGKVALALSLLSYFVVALDGSIVFTGLEKISADLRLDQTSLSWVQNAYVLAFGGFMLTGGRLGDAFGRRLALDCSLAVFALGSFMAGVARSAEFMIFARFVQGAAAAVLAPTALALIMDYFSGGARTKAVAWYGSISGLGLCVGLIFGGLLTSLYSWRLGFFANIPLSASMIFLSRKYLKSGGGEKCAFDIRGTLLSVCGIFAFVYAVNGAENAPLWLAIAAVLLALFARAERRAASPVMPLGLFASGVRSRAYFARILLIGALMGFNFFMSEYMQRVLNFDAFRTGLGFFPLTICTFFGAVKVPRFVEKYGNYKTLFAGAVLMLAGFGLLAASRGGYGYFGAIASGMVFVGFGQGLAMSPLTNLGLENVGRRDAGAASGVVNAAHQIGGATGLSLMVALSSDAENFARAFEISMWIALLLIAAILPTVFAKLPRRSR